MKEKANYEITILYYAVAPGKNPLVTDLLSFLFVFEYTVFLIRPHPYDLCGPRQVSAHWLLHLITAWKTFTYES